MTTSEIIKQIKPNCDELEYQQLYKAGIHHIIENIDYYIDKPFSCHSVLQTLFKEGIIKQIKFRAHNPEF